MPSEKSIGTYQHDNAQDAQKFIQKTIQNDGAFIPSGLQMILNLRSVTNGQNPTSIDSVGLGNFTQALSALSSLFSSSKSSSNSNTANVNPCSIPEAQRTPEQQYDCDILMAIANATSNTANETFSAFTPPTVDQTANTVAYYQAISDIANVVMIPVTNNIVANVTSLSTIANNIIANSTFVTTVATEVANDVNALVQAPTILTSGSSFVTNNGTNFLYVECVGGGGNGGNGNTSPFFGGGGGAGAYVAKYFVVLPNTAYSYVVGGPNQNTTFTVNSVTITAQAGANGVDANTTAFGTGGLGGTGLNGDINTSGGSGIASGMGGASFFGGGYGAGGMGGGPPNLAGTSGIAGVIRVWQYT